MLHALDGLDLQLHPVAISMLVCIVKVPPARMLEGLDLTPYRLRRSEIRELPRPLADVLMAWGYAEPFPDRRRPGNPRVPPRSRDTASKK